MHIMAYMLVQKSAQNDSMKDQTEEELYVAVKSGLKVSL